MRIKTLSIAATFRSCLRPPLWLLSFPGEGSWHTNGTLAAPKPHHVARGRATKSLCLQVVGGACWCTVRTFNPLVVGSIPTTPYKLLVNQCVERS
jgi:hypothetical protein